VGLLAAAQARARSGSSLRAGAAGRALARGHEKAWPFPGGRQAHPERSGEANRHVGWQHLHIAIDDHTRLAYAEVLAGQDKQACAAFLRRAVAWYAQQGIQIERVLSDNAKAYHSRLWQDTCAQLDIARRYTRPYTPRTNGKAEALIKTMLREWAYRYAYPSSHHRTKALSGWTRWYNQRRPHGSLGGKPPISRVSHLRGQYT